MRVLVIGSGESGRAALAEAVRDAGYECVEAADGTAASEAHGREPFDVVIIDLEQSGTPDTELCRRLRESEGEWYAHVILIGGQSEKLPLNDGPGAGADEYLQGPVDRDELRARLAAVERIISMNRRLLAQKRILEKLNRDLDVLSRRDHLTGLANRVQLWEDLEVLHGRVQRYGHSYSIALFDVDQFKKYNDVYGHLAGDNVLKAVAGVIGAGLRTGDAAYRFGGEEFVAVLPQQGNESAIAAVERLRRAVEVLGVTHEGNPPWNVVTISAGVATHDPGADASVEKVLQAADTALYVAKAAGRNTVKVRPPS